MLARLKKFYKEHELLTDILFIALILRIIYLNVIERFVGDELYYLDAARQILATGVDPNIIHPPLVKMLLAASIALFGDNSLAWRLPSVFFGLASIALFYFVVLEVSKNKKIAVLSAALLAFDPLHIVISRLGQLDIFMMTFGFAGCWFMLKRNWSWAGVLFGLGIASKEPAILMFAAASAFLYSKKKLKLPDFAFILTVIVMTFLLVNAPFIFSEGPAQWVSVRLAAYMELSSHEPLNVQTSSALEWLFLQRPEWFTWDVEGFASKAPAGLLWFANLFGGNPAFAMIALGNPVSWIPGMLALIWLGLNKAKKMPDVRLFSIIWFLFTYVPFLFLPYKKGFFYYMLPVIPAYFLALSQFLAEKKIEKPFLIVLALSVLLFLPLIISLPAPQSYFELLRPLIGSMKTP